MTDHISDFRDAMAADGLKFRNLKDRVVADGKLHRFDVDGDASGSKNGWYVLHVDDRPAGQFGCAKRFGIERKLTWTAKGSKPLTREERAALDVKIAKERAEADAAKAEIEAAATVKARAMWAGAVEATEHPYLTRKGIGAHGARIGEFVRALRPGANGEPREHRVPGALLIPMRGAGSREPISLQAVYADPINVGGDERRAKDFVYGGRKRGLWYAIGKPGKIDGVETFAICEGFATGGSIHEATGLAVIVAFDAGNLLPVAEALRGLRPDACILICADDDCFTTRADGTAWNPGWEKACAAAHAIDGKAVRPVFASLDTKPTDYNDLHALQGLEEVRRQIMGAFEPEPSGEPAEPETDHSEPDGPAPAPPPGTEEDYGLPATVEPERVEERASIGGFSIDPKSLRVPLDTGGKFEVMGYEEDKIFIRITESGVILGEKPSYWKSNLSLLAHPDHWERLGLADKAVIAMIVQDAYTAGRFNLGMARGLGAWEDEGRHVFYLGESIIADGFQMAPRDFETDHIYYSRDNFRFPGEVPMAASEGRELLGVIESLSWARNSSPILLAGWLALAPICGALKWRPHAWVCGPAGAGKTTAMELIDAMIKGYSLYSNGNSTEAGLRQTLLTSARPVVMDEGEQLSEKEAVAMQAIITLARQSSSGSAARTYKGGQDGNAMNFTVRSMFCFGSIQVGLHHQQDKQRISILHLKKPPSKTAADDWRLRIEPMITEMKERPDVSSRLVRRAIDLLPVTLKNVSVFTSAAAKLFGSQRLGDQYGTLVAGAWSLVSNRLVTPEEASAKIAAYDWNDYTDESQVNESEMALEALMNLKVFVKAGAEPTVRELALAATGQETLGITLHEQDAVRHLGMLGMSVDRKSFAQYGVNGAHIMIHSNNAERDAILRKASVVNLGQMLLRLDGVDRLPNMFRINGIQKRGLTMPLFYLTDGFPGEGGAAIVPFVGEDEPMGDMPLDLDDRIDF